MDKKAIIIIVAIVLVGLGVGTWLYHSVDSAREAGEKLAEPFKEAVLPEGYVLFYGQECPHCQKVEEFLKEKDMASKVAYTTLEVWHNDDNRNTMLLAAKNCQLKVKEVGVPLLYDGQKCYIGEFEVMDFFTQKAAEEQN